jgi:hypothetical protein
MRKPFLLVLTALAILEFSSCRFSAIPGYIKREFKYSPAINKQSQYLSYDGLYREMQIGNRVQVLCSKQYYTHGSDSVAKQKIEFDMVFLKNGLCTMGYLDGLRTDRSKEEKEKFKNGSSYWGYYEVNRDTLKVKVIQRNSFMAARSDAFEQWYQILDSKTLKPVYFRSIDKGTCTEKYGQENWIDTTQYTKAKFYKIDENVIGQNSGWLINKKWFWKDANEYRTCSK